jgi:hypothetical protein
MKRATSLSPDTKGRVSRDGAGAKAGQARKRRARAILAHVEAAKARKSGVDITSLEPDELIADLLRHQVNVRRFAGPQLGASRPLRN